MRGKVAGRGNAAGLDAPFAALLVLCVAAAWALWVSPLLVPFRLFVTLIHEFGHALAAVLTGGHVLGIMVRLDGSGLTLVEGGNLFITASAGYLGSSLFGAGLLLAARAREHRRLLLRALTVGLVAATVFFVRNPTGIGSAALLAVVFWLVAARGPDWLVSLLVCWLAVLNGLYAVNDLVVLLELSGPAASASDAATLQRATGVPALVWAVGWTVLAVAAQYWALRRALVGPAAPRVRSGRAR